MNALIPLLQFVSKLAEARKAHDEGKSDPSRNVGTGQVLYAAERAFGDALDGFTPDVFAKIMNRVEAMEVRVLELEQRFSVTKCPECGTLGRRGHSHMYGHVTGSHIQYKSCDGLEK